MNKIASLKQKLVNFAIKSGIAVAACAGLAYFANNYFTQQSSELQQVESQINQKRNEIVQIEDNINIYEKSFNLFQNLTAKIKDGKYDLDIQRSGKVLELLGRKHRITNLSVDITTKEKLGSVEYIGFIPIFREVNLKFSSMSDAHIYAFVSSIQQYFMGHLQCTKISITQKNPLNSSVFVEVSKGATPDLLEASISFLWLGIEEKLIVKK